MAAMIAVVYPHMTHVGGDGFWLIRFPNGRLHTIMAAGPAGEYANPDFYRGFETIPPRGPFAALTVPGAVGGWIRALEAAKANSGKLPTNVVLLPAIVQARNGYVVSRGQARLTAEKLFELSVAPGFAETFLRDGEAPGEGSTLSQEALATTLRHLALEGLDDFYRGDVAREMAADLDHIGSPVTRDDLENYEATFGEPLRFELPVGTIYNTDAPTQGVASLMILALFDRLRVTEPEGFDYVHTLVEATKRALRTRDRVLTDPSRLAHPLDRCLEPRFIAGEAMKIDRRKAARSPFVAAGGDTIWMGAADTSGLVVSYIQSIYWEFGSGCVLPRTGVLMQNRGASFSLQRGALNLVAPGRSPIHTLNPAMAVLKDGRIMAYGTMGGDGQPQTQAAVFTRHVTFGVPLDAAIDRPRWLFGRTWGDESTRLRLESRFDGNLVDQLASAGHEIEVLSEPYSDTMGHAGAAVLHPDGTCEAAHDPRADGGAAGL
jgi:gamma-glutamyltranspeptidase